jgi:hypothetical protein
MTPIGSARVEDGEAGLDIRGSAPTSDRSPNDRSDATDEDKPEPVADGKDPAAVALGRKGGLKGGKARAEKLTAEQRSEIARKAAATR